MSQAATDPSNTGSTLDPDAAVEVACPHCGSKHPVRAQVLGKLARCTSCTQRFVLRQPERAAAPELANDTAAVSTPHLQAEPAPAVSPVATRPVATPSVASTPPPFEPQRLDPAAAESVDQPPATPTPSSVEAATAPVLLTPPPPPPPVAPTPLAPAPATPPPRAALILRFAAIGFEACAAIGLVVGCLWSLFVLVSSFVGTASQAETYVLFGGAVLSFAWSVAASATLFVGAQLLRIAVHIEDNTRRAADAGKREPLDAGLQD